ncbi:unnamed protein product [Ambrosiozyma monospora]|uniref:Unnamed protein product n=1 Tax=Ambrosiozyma monospora TaxID=43982 RepID=A0ACB5STF1_AMBMO|nr:unnamed protein product [Ambrosiozyma monospora]
MLVLESNTFDSRITPVPCDEMSSLNHFNDYVKSFSSEIMKILQANHIDQMVKHKIWLILCSLKSKEYEDVDVNGNELALHVAIVSHMLADVRAIMSLKFKGVNYQIDRSLPNIHAPQLLRECIFCGSEYGVLTNSIDYWIFKFEIDPNKLPFAVTGKLETRYLYWHCPPVNSPITAKMMICLLYDIQAKEHKSSDKTLLKKVKKYLYIIL